MQEENPCQSPMEASLVEPLLNPQTLLVASQYRRAVNCVLDSIVIRLLDVALWFVMVRTGISPLFNDSFSRLLIAIFIILFYYVPQEYFGGRTISKFITGTKVVSAEGTTLTLSQIIGRTFYRMIPLEVFSFNESYPVGWHDKFSGTCVVLTRSTPTANP